jgi:hypothetical protein
MTSQPKAAGKAASKLISEKIAELGDWRGDTLAKMRALVGEVDPDVVEEWKWMGTPVWSRYFWRKEVHETQVSILGSDPCRRSNSPGNSWPPTGVPWSRLGS